MANLTNTDKQKLEKFLEMSGGGVLDFTYRTFQEFIFDSVKIDIFAEKYNYRSASKANRLRAFWSIESDSIVGQFIDSILEYWKTKKLLENNTNTEHEQLLFNECRVIAKRLLGQKIETTLSRMEPETETDFINREFKNLSLDKLLLDNVVTAVLNQRIEEIRKCLNAKASLGVIFLCGSTLEGILLGIASSRPREFNSCPSSPKNKEGMVLPFNEWKLSSFIDVACSLGMLGEDVKKFGHALRDFRNYIHPYQQITSQFNPNEHTAQICWKVLQAAIDQLSKNTQHSYI